MKPMKASDTDQEPARSARVLVVLDTSAGWSRGILRGFMAVAHQYDWALLHYHQSVEMSWLAAEWKPEVAVVGPDLPEDALAELAPATVVSVNFDRSGAGIASVCVDEEAIAQRALRHLLDTGLRHVSTFHFDSGPFAAARERAFVAGAIAAGAQVSPGWGAAETTSPRREDPAAILDWLRQLRKPCGIFSFTDSWGRVVARYVRAAGFRVPEDIALVGADNDVLECELLSPPLSSVMIPWQELGGAAAQLVHLHFCGKAIQGKRIELPPIAVMARRTSDIFAIQDPLVAKAVRWIRANAEQRLTVDMVAQAVGGGRKRLERRFRAALDRTVHDEIRRAHVDMAKTLLETTNSSLIQVAKGSGFRNAALLSVAFHRDMGMPPGLYRRRVQHELGGLGSD
jgi:LacI family transcriptional regulator